MLTLEFFVILYCHLHAVGGKYRVESAHTVFLFYFGGAASAFYNLLNVLYAAHNVGFGAFGFGGVMFQNIFYVVGNAAMVVESLFGFDAPNLLVLNVVFHTHCADIVDMKF